MSISDPKREYRINAVARLTGVPAGTLRAWERRYGVPTPRRTGSAYRVYNDDDVALIRRILELSSQGVSLAEAAAMSLAEVKRTSGPGIAEDPYEPLRQNILEAVARYDVQALDASLQRLMVLGTAWLIYEKVIRPVMVTIGDKWHAGELSIGQEHLASTALEGVTRRLLELVSRPTQVRRILLGCFADETHTMPLYGMAIKLAESGFNGVILGERTPPEAVRQAVRELDPLVVGLSLTIAPQPRIARSLVDGYADACGDVPWVIGGQGANDIRSFVEDRNGLVLDGDPNVSLETIEKLAVGRLRS